MVTDQIADMLTRIRNAQMAGHPSVIIPKSGEKENIANVLLKEGYIEGVETIDNDGKPVIKLSLRYDDNNQPIIKELTRLSSSGRRVYVGKEDIPQNRNGLGVVIVSTSKGVLSDLEARQLGVGGELLCSVF